MCIIALNKGDSYKMDSLSWLDYGARWFMPEI